MRAVDIIQKKRLGKILTKAELEYFLQSYLTNKIPDYQMSAFLMAVVFNGMGTQELTDFTDIMAKSGDTIELPNIERFIIDKHSTGGVGDKTSIALAPLLASLGMGVAKLSGRGLGHTGGTIDKFESIKNFTFINSAEMMMPILEKSGIGLMQYSDAIVPLDKKLYALRDVTATVESIPLIASSIMSKKLAVQSDAILLDVKVGNGAFMKTVEQAKELAETMFSIGKSAGRNISCLLTNMNQPLGNTVGNSLEVIEAIETLKGNGPKDFTQLVLYLAGMSLVLKKDVATIDEGIEIAQSKLSNTIDSNHPLTHLATFIELSGGNKDVINNYNLLPTATHTLEIPAEQNGYLSEFETAEIGRAAMLLGAGRATKDDVIDFAVGITLHKKTGDTVNIGESLATIHYNNETNLNTSIEIVKKAISISHEQALEPELILEKII